MGRAIEVPVTPSVLRWAIAESGIAPEELAHAIGVSPSLLQEWESGSSKPTLSHARELANKLHRPLAAFLLPSPPETKPLGVEFRHPVGDRRQLNPTERRYLRRAARLQELLSWLVTELAIDRPRTPSANIQDDPSIIAKLTRQFLRVSAIGQKAWGNPSVAFDGWREALERTGHLVFLFSMGKDSCRGFSLWDDYAPVIAINTAWNESARIFTLFHEMGHLITRTSSACVESIKTSSKADPVERWCETFAAHLLMPTEDVVATLRQEGFRPGSHVANLGVVRKIASTYKVSLRAAAIRLIELKTATWELYDQIPPVSDKKAGGGGTGRNRTQIREDQVGNFATSLLVNAVNRDVINRSQAIDLLDVPDTSFEEISRKSRID